MLDLIPLQLDRERVLKEREDGERGGGRGVDYSREAISGGTAIIRGTTASLLLFIIP